MSQKVWVIGDPEPDVRSGMIPGSGPDSKNRKKESSTLPETAQKNPAVSFSLSMLVWGGGHMYIGQWRSGLTYLAAMALFYSIIAIGYTSGIPELNLGAMIVCVFGLMAWMYGAADAYYRTLHSRVEPFLGVEKTIWPVGGSFLFPGWGQFLNGQPRKGIFFLFFGVGGVFSVFALLLIRHVWPLLVLSEDRHLFEVCLMGVLSFIPVVFLMWIVAVYDAFRSCEYFLRFKQRSKLNGKRLQGSGFLADLVPQFSAVLGLMLAISLGMQFYPKQYYLDSLKNVRVEMLNSRMTILPELVQKTIEFLS